MIAFLWKLNKSIFDWMNKQKRTLETKRDIIQKNESIFIFFFICIGVKADKWVSSFFILSINTFQCRFNVFRALWEWTP